MSDVKQKTELNYAMLVEFIKKYEAQLLKLQELEEKADKLNINLNKIDARNQYRSAMKKIAEHRDSATLEKAKSDFRKAFEGFQRFIWKHNFFEKCPTSRAYKGTSDAKNALKILQEISVEINLVQKYAPEIKNIWIEK